MSQNATNISGLNRAKLYQLVLFPLNNGATNVYYVLILSYIATFGNAIMVLSAIILYMITPNIPADMQWLRYTAFVGLYAVWV